ncbi:putative Ig domain-containing protein [Scytonema sp. NUACC26]|uniref:putative Ig domain-containing protein n=1 Tax=Scytonema sp. NUACC26 TaxID=3140176 RepID=UPI0034DBEC10
MIAFPASSSSQESETINKNLFFSQTASTPEIEQLLEDTVVVPGRIGEPITLHFKWTEREAAFNNEVGVFIVDELGRVDGVTPGEAGYARSAINSSTRQIIFSSGQGVGTKRELTFRGGDRLAFYIIQDKTTDTWLNSNQQNQLGKEPLAFFSIENTNPDKFDHVSTQIPTNALVQLNWEDLTGGGDRDFNDVVFTIGKSRQALSVPGQIGQKVATKFTWTDREAAFNNELGLFIVDDATGKIGNLLPTDPGYAQAALNSASRQIVFNSGQTEGAVKNLELPSQVFFGFYLIQNATTEKFLNQNPQNEIGKGPLAFFLFPSVNPDEFDHIVELPLNQLGWEDLTGGGDKDFDDLVFRYEFGTPVGTILAPTLDLALESDSGVSNSDNITRDSTPTIIGNTEVGAVVQLYNGSVLLGQTTADTTGNWEITTGELNNGTQNLTAVATDTVGNVSPVSSPLPVLIDTVNPLLNPASPIDTAPLQSGARLTGTIDGTGSGIASLSYKFDNSSEIPLAFNAAGVFDQTIDFTGIQNGDRTLVITSTDIAGNITTSQFNVIVATGGGVQNRSPEITSQPETDYTVLRNSDLQLKGIPLGTTQAGLSEIEGQAFLDFDRNGLRSQEAGLDGFAVELVNPATGEIVATQIARSVDLDGNGRINPVTEQGLYRFTNLQAGTYEVRQVSKDGWSSIPTSATYNLTLNNSDRVEEINFGNAQNYFYQVQATDADGDTLTYSLLSAPTGATIDSTTGKLTWTPPTTGEYVFKAKVEDGKGGQDIQEFTLNVLDPNRLPSITSNPTENATVGQNYTYQIIADNPDLDGLDFQLNQAPQGMSVSPDGLIQWTPQANQVGAQQVKLLVKDDRGGEVEQVFTILTQGSSSQSSSSDNFRPVITSNPVTTVAATAQYTYDVDAIDPDNDVLKYSLLTAPQGMTIDQNTGLISWNTSTQTAGNYNINVQVEDGKGGFDTQGFTLALSNTPPGEIRGVVWDDLNGNGIRDTSFAQGANPDVVFVIDVSFSADDPFVGSPVGDLNLDRQANTILDAEIAGFIALNQQLIQQGLGQTARVSVIDFAGSASSRDMIPNVSGKQLVTNPTADRDNNGVLDVEQVLRSLSTRSATNFESALKEAENVFKTIGTTPGNGTLVFLSDGVSNAGSITDEVNNLKALGVKLYAFGVGEGAALNDRDRLDDDLITIDSNAKIFKNTDELLSTFNDLGGGQNVVEPGLGGVRVYLDLNNNAAFDADEPTQVTSDTTGQYRFTGLLPNTYTVRQVVPNGYTQTFPGGQGGTRGDGYADVVLEYFAAGNAPDGLQEPYGSNGGIPSFQNRLSPLYTVETVNPNVVLGAPGPSPVVGSNPQVNWLALPQGSYVTVGFTDETVIDGPGNDIFIRSFDPQDSAGESADVFVSSNGTDFNFLGRVNQLGVQGLDLASIGFTDPVRAVRVVGVDNLGTSPGFDLVSVEVLPDSIGPAPGFYTVNLGAGEIVENRNFGNQQNVTKPNQVPNFITAPPTEAQTGKLFRYDATATDPDGDVLTYELVEKPTGMAIDSERGALIWQPAADQIGNYNVVLRVQDGKGGSAQQSFQINVGDGIDRQVPVVNLGFTSNVVQIGENVTFTVAATDNAGVDKIALTVDGNPVTLDNTGSATVQLNQAGVFQVVATATDTAGNIVQKAVSLRVLDPSDTTAPQIQIISPQTSKTVTNLTDVVGTVTDDNLEFYRVEYAALDQVDINNLAAPDPDFVTFAQGKTSVNNAVLGEFDPTLLLNGNYVVRVIAQDFSGNINSQGVLLGVSGDNKLGNFRLELTDLSIPLAGIPIQINRIYDTLQANQSGDFGFGWSLGVKDAKIQESVPLTEAEKQGVPSIFGSNPFTAGTKVYLTNPEGRRVGFTFDPFISGVSLLGTIWKPRFIADPGVYDKLEVDDINLSQRSDGTFALFFIPFAYNPSEYKLTTKDGTTYEYDQFDGLQEIKDRNNNTLTFNDNGIFSSTGASVEFLRDTQGRITQISDPTGKAILYNYDAKGNLVGVTDQAGLVSRHTYLNNRNYLEQIIDPRGQAVIRTEYDEKGRVKATKDALGNTISNDYNVSAGGSTVTQLDALGNTTTTVRDSRGNITSVINPLGAITRTSYDTNNNPISVTDPRGSTTTRIFDARGNVTNITDGLGNTRTFTYDQFNNVTSEIDSLGRTTRFVYNTNGNLVELIDATGQRDRFTYDNLGRVSTFTDANSNTITFGYEGTTLGKPTQVTFPDGSSQRIEYNQFGQITRLVDENGNATDYITDSVGRLVAQRDALGNETKYTYDAQLISSITDQLGNTVRFEYDNAGRLTRQIDPFNAVTEFGYDALGRRISEIDPLGRTTTTTYRPDGLIASIANSQNQKTSFEYDLAGNQTAVIDPLGNLTGFGYDAVGRQIRKTDPLGNVATYGYDGVNNLVQLTDRNNRQRTFTYDGVNRLIQENWLNNNTPERTINFTYDAVGNLIKSTDVDSTYNFVYDSRDRVTQVNSTGITGLVPVNLNYTYDGTGNRTSVSDNLGVRVNSTYDVRNLLTSQTWQGTGIDPARVEYSYDSRGDRTQTRRFSDLAGTQLVGSSTFSYDELQRLTSLTHFNGAGSTLANYDYNYNLASILSSETYKAQTTNYTYDGANQLVNADRSVLPDENYTYDANGNRTGSGLIVGANNQILSNGNFNYSYDREGNLATKTNRSTGNVTSYTYDFRARLVGVTDKEASGNTTQSVEFKYDAFDRRISKTVNGETTYFVNDGDELWAELNQAGQVINHYLQGANVDELVARYRPGEGTAWYLSDRLRSIRDIANSVGNLVNSIDYDSFGKILSQTNSSAGDRFAFTGREFDSETGLYYNRARYYDANLGRFISQDPIGFGGEDSNLYRYVSNNPVNAIDPSGLIAALEYSVRLGKVAGVPIKGELKVNELAVSGAVIGGLQGFGVTNLIFIGEVLGIASNNNGSLTESDFSTALDNTRKKVEDIATNLTRGRAVFPSNNFLSSYISGVEFKVLPDLNDAAKRAIYVTGNTPTIESLGQGGFKRGYEVGLDYIRSQVNIR